MPKDKNYKEKDEIPWNQEVVMDEFLKQIDFKNGQIDTYSRLCNAMKPILEKYQKYFKEVNINWGFITLILKEDCDIPPMYCECDVAGLSAIYKESKYESVVYDHSYDTVTPSRSESFKRVMEVRLK